MRSDYGCLFWFWDILPTFTLLPDILLPCVPLTDSLWHGIPQMHCWGLLACCVFGLSLCPVGSTLAVATRLREKRNKAKMDKSQLLMAYLFTCGMKWDGLTLSTSAGLWAHPSAPWVCHPWVLRAVCLNQKPFSQPITAHSCTTTTQRNFATGAPYLKSYFFSLLLLVQSWNSD